MASFKNRLLILIVALMALAQGVTVLLSLADLSTRVRAESARQLRSSRTLLDQLLANRAAQLDAAGRVLVADFAFRSAVATNDHDTIVSALSNHAGRINADLAVIFDADGKAMASSKDSIPAAAIQLPDEIGDTATPVFAVVGHRLYEMVFAPVRAPTIIGWVALGFGVDEQFAQQLKSQIDADVSFVSHTAQSQQVLISTLPALYEAPPNTAGTNEITVAQRPYLMLSAPINVQHGQVELAVLRSMDEALSQFAQMRFALLLISSLALLGAILVAWLVGRSAVRPLGQLVNAAQRVQSGNYQHSINIGGGEEFEKLAHTFNAMQQGIREREARIVEQATYDTLTGLINRTALCAALDDQRESSTALSVAKLDIRRFRDINASLGHAVGDEVLCALAAHLKQIVPASLVARVSADRFAVVMPLQDTQVMQHMMLLIDELQQGLQVGKLTVGIELHIGISEWRMLRVPVDDWLRQAEVALLESKERGLAVVAYQASHDAEHRRRIMLVSELRRAIAEDGLSLMYQPLSQMTNREPVSFEALIRWTHPTLGNISPSEFIPLAERASIIGEITRWVLRTAIMQLGEWRRQGFEIDIAVNLSAGDVTDLNLSKYILNLLREHQVATQQLILEVTESAIMHDPHLAVQSMQQLRSLGIRFAIDDFGTGHSSLAQLHTLPVDELKIDRAFVRNVDSSANNAAIVRTTTELGHSLGLKVVVEGVETPEEWHTLLNLGCDLVQGYYISRPMSAQAVLEWTTKQRHNLAQAKRHAVADGTLADIRTRLPS